MPSGKPVDVQLRGELGDNLRQLVKPTAWQSIPGAVRLAIWIWAVLTIAGVPSGVIILWLALTV